jgi:hypothetical protein
MAHFFVATLPAAPAPMIKTLPTGLDFTLPAVCAEAAWR